jgi:hypothetical protein
MGWFYGFKLHLICNDSRHRAMHDFAMNLISALTAYCFFEKKPAIHFEMAQTTAQLVIF